MKRYDLAIAMCFIGAAVCLIVATFELGAEAKQTKENEMGTIEQMQAVLAEMDARLALVEKAVTHDGSLMPCILCAGDAKAYYTDELGRGWYVLCPNWDCKNSFIPHERARTRTTAVLKWNMAEGKGKPAKGEPK